MVHLENANIYLDNEQLKSLESYYMDLINHYESAAVYRRFRHMNAYESEWLYIVDKGRQCRIKFFKSYSTLVGLALETNIDSYQRQKIDVVVWRHWKDRDGKGSVTTGKQITTWVYEMEKYAYIKHISGYITEYEAYSTFDREGAWY